MKKNPAAPPPIATFTVAAPWVVVPQAGFLLVEDVDVVESVELDETVVELDVDVETCSDEVEEEVAGLEEELDREVLSEGEPPDEEATSA